MQKLILLIAVIFGAFAVGLGAFGAHMLKPLLEQFGKVGTFETAVKYHFYHTLLLLLIGVILGTWHHKLFMYSAYSLIGGIILFSGSLYIMSIFNYTKLGMITPLGGLLFIAGWIMLGLGIYKSL